MTLEEIEKIESDLPWHGDVTALDIGELCTLAKRGLSTMPRPISEAPKDGTFIERKYIYAIHPISLSNGHILFGIMTDRTGDSRDYQPTHFIPISALDLKP